MNRRIALAYAAIGAVYLLYLPHALPVLDDWMYLQLFHQARAGGVLSVLTFLRRVIDNTWLVQFRIFWASLMPVFALASAADFRGWAYFLLALSAHLLTAVLLARIVSLISGDAEIGFFAGAVYAVFPAANNALFWPVSTCIYYFQSLGFLWWFYITWKKLAVSDDYRYRWRDFALLLPVAFSGEQILPALAFLLPITHLLLGKHTARPAFLRFWFTHLAVMGASIGFYALAVNGMPIWKGFQNRYHASQPWSLRPPGYFLSGALGLHHDFVPRPAGWWADFTLTSLVCLAALAFFWGLRAAQNEKSARDPRLGELLLWSTAGVILTYLPLASLSTFEMRYLYVPSMFLVSAGIAAAGLAARPLRTAFVFAALLYCLAQTYLEMRQCWIPQSREARALIDALAAAAPYSPGEVFIFSGDHLLNGLAPSFITGASWAMQSMLEHATAAGHVQGARDLVVNEKGELALYRRDGFRYFHRHELNRLRVFVRRPDNRFVAKSVLALPAPGGRFELLPLGSGAAAQLPQISPHPLTSEELQRLPIFPEIYFARRITSHAKSTDL
jgi:hypothetical protein